MSDGLDHLARLGIAPGRTPRPGEDVAAPHAVPPIDPRLPGPAVGRAQIEAIFMSAAMERLEGGAGLLRYTAREHLLDLAARIGIEPFEANLLIERARYRATRGVEDSAAAVVEDPPPSRNAARRWIFAIALALALDAALLGWLFLA